MRQYDAADYGRPVSGSPGPLFAEPGDGPFARSRIRPEPLEGLIAGVIWRHRGRMNPISIAEIIRTCATRLDERTVKRVVEQLRLAHRCRIGARREEPHGYYRIVDRADLEAAIRPYLHQIRAMARVIRALCTEAEWAEYSGQARLEFDASA